MNWNRAIAGETRLRVGHAARVATRAGCWAALLLAACHQTAAPPSVTDNASAAPVAGTPAPAEPPAQEPVQEPLQSSKRPERAVVEPPATPLPPDPDQWLFVEKIKAGTRGGWATGSFDEKKNKLIIEHREVEQFLVESSKIKIDWERPVILSINGEVSELRRRKTDAYRFARDTQGAWIVVE